MLCMCVMFDALLLRMHVRSFVLRMCVMYACFVCMYVCYVCGSVCYARTLSYTCVVAYVCMHVVYVCMLRYVALRYVLSVNYACMLCAYALCACYVCKRMLRMYQTC